MKLGGEQEIDFACGLTAKCTLSWQGQARDKRHNLIHSAPVASRDVDTPPPAGSFGQLRAADTIRGVEIEDLIDQPIAFVGCLHLVQRYGIEGMRARYP